MFTEPVTVEDLSVAQCADALVDSVATLRRAEATRLALAAHWADTHPPGDGGTQDPDDLDLSRTDGVRLDDPRTVGRRGRNPRAYGEVGVQLGGEGVPAVAEFAAVELGLLLQTSTHAATVLMRDALELRHRLPRVWAGVVTGQVEPWQARRAAGATRVLDLAACLEIDQRVLDALAGLPFSRAIDTVEGLVVSADPAGHECRLAQAAARRHVSVSKRPTPGDLRALVMQSTVGDVARVDAMVEHLATLLAAAGDTDGRDLRRTKALVLMADPARACLLLADLQQEPGEPAGSEPPSAAERAASLGAALAGLDARAQRRLRPRTVLHVHLAEEALTSLRLRVGTGHPGAEVARVEALGAVGLAELRAWIGEDVVEVRPVVDPAEQGRVDAYEIPPDITEAMALREPVEVFPWGTTPATRADLDHTVPWVPPDEGGPPGQTGVHNLGPLGRHHHRAKTFGGFACHQPLPGLYLWRTPSGHWFRVDPTGSHALGRDEPEILQQLRDSAAA